MNEPHKKRCAAAGDNYIIDIDKSINNIVSMDVDKSGSVCHRVSAPHLEKIAAKFLIPGSRRLLETIQCLAEATDVVRAIRINEARRLRDIYFVGESALEESVVDVQLFYDPTSSDR